MDIEQAIQLADELISRETGKHLDELQRLILHGAWHGKTYAKIADDDVEERSEGHIKDVGSQLFKDLSEALKPRLNKSNFRAHFERLKIGNLGGHHNTNNNNDNSIKIGKLNFCQDLPYHNKLSDLSDDRTQSSSQSIQDLRQMQRIGAFYNRTSELSDLKTAILEDNCTLIALTGITGIGKTALATQLVDQIKDEFDCLLWYNMNKLHITYQQNLPDFADFQARFNSLISPENNDAPIIDYCQNYRCLMILDNFQYLFTPRELAGKYLPETASWQQFLQQITNLPHQSCCIIITQELPKEIDDMADNRSDLKILYLNGLEPDATSQILGEIDSLIDYSLHQGHPGYLKAIAFMNKKLTQIFRDILAKKMPIFPEDLRPSFEEQFDRLSDLEQQIMLVLAQENEPINVDKLLESIEISLTDLVNVLQSLTRRGLLIKDDHNLSLEPIVRLYLTVAKSING